MNTDFMNRAIDLAKAAAQNGEVPVGAVIVKGDTVIASAHNTCVADKNPLMHAEIKVINEALRVLNTSNLSDCTLYVTLEPCVMCAGAVINAKVGTLVFGAYDNLFGAFGGKFDISNTGSTFLPEIYGGIKEAETSLLLTDFFKNIRDNKNEL